MERMHAARRHPRPMVGEHHIKTRIANQLFSCKSSVGTMFWEKNVMQIMSFHKKTKWKSVHACRWLCVLCSGLCGDALMDSAGSFVSFIIGSRG